MVHDSVHSDEGEPVDTPAAFLHMRAMAKRYLHDPGTFLKRAALDMTLTDQSPGRLALLEAGFRQIVEWRGFSPDKPFRGLSVDGFYAMLQALDFRVVRQTAQPVDPCFFVDATDVEHESLGLDVTLYNLASGACASEVRGAPPPAGLGGAGSPDRAAQRLGLAGTHVPGQADT